MMLDNGFKNFPWYDKLPPIEEDINDHNLHEFFRLMYERQEIWYKRNILKQPAPWTEDVLLRDYKFTNVYRELDRSSQWLIKNILLQPYNSKEDLIFRIILYRYFNNPDTFEVVKLPHYEDYNQKEFHDEIDNYQNTYGNPFTIAYFINVSPCTGSKRHCCYCNIHIPFLHKSIPNIIKAIGTAEEKNDVMIIINELNKLKSVSDFISHEFYQDFTYVPYYTNDKLMNFNGSNYINSGPGCQTGLRLIFPSAQTKSLQEECLHLLWEIGDEYLKKFGDFKYISWNKKEQKYDIQLSEGKLLLHTLEMWACEFQKHWKMKINQGKQRSKFKPTIKKVN